MIQPIQVLIVDDDAWVRDGFRTMLAAQATITVCGEAASGEEAVQLAASLHPDVILMDLRMGDGKMKGIDATRQITWTYPAMAVVIVTSFGDDESVFAAMRAGARGFIVKGAQLPSVMTAIEVAYQGEALFSPTIARRMMRYFAALAGAREALSDLTKREYQILQALAAGSEPEEIAQHLDITTKTVRNHLATICNKLQVADRDQAIRRFRDAGTP